ncbi:MAG: lysylphosphatidylglycerol synthase transmembrane domain-containing protein [bacterium]
MADGRAVQKRFLLSVVLGVGVFFALIVFGNAKETGIALHHIAWRYLPSVFALAFLNYCIRFIRWHYYLRISKICLPFAQSLTVFFCGLSMSITPGKIGEVVKAYFVKTLNGTPMSSTLGIVFVERFTDLFAVVLLASIGALSFHYGQIVVFIGAAIVFFILAIIINRRLSERLIRLLARVRRLSQFSEKLFTVYEHSHRLLSARPLTIGLMLGILAWFSECFAFFLVLQSLQIPLSLTMAIFIYAFSTLFGAMTMLPGGLATTEGSMAGLLLLRGIPKDAAAAATIVIRIATLWFAVLFGILWMLPYRKMTVKAKMNSEKQAHGTL